MGAHSIWVLEYSRSPIHPVSGVFYGAHNQGTMNLPFAYILIKSRDAVVLVDVGHDATDFGGGQIANSSASPDGRVPISCSANAA